ncbi:MAG: c-type cytochrome [Bauldia sp.]
MARDERQGGRRGGHRALGVALAGPLTACNGPQSILDPAGPAAGAVNGLGWVMTGAAIVIAALVVVATAIALGRRGGTLGSVRTVIAGGIVLPAVLLPVLLIAGLLVARGSGATGTEPVTIRVTGEQFWWRVDYLDAAGDVALTTANEIRVPVGVPVRLILESADVIHSFWVPALGGKLDMIPGRSNAMAIEADRAGVFRGQCAEFCGDQHARMAFIVIAEEPETFGAWLAAEAAPAVAAEAAPAAGAAAFVAAGCGACHTVRGTGAAGTIGPDLTHIGSRQTIAAGTLPNDLDSRVLWIAGAQRIKPGSRMPSFAELPEADLRAIATYLGTLR